MNVTQKSNNKQKDDMIIYPKSEKKLVYYPSENKNEKSDIDKETINLFKGIVRITNISKVNKKSIEKSISVNNNHNISEFTNNLFNEEEHMNKIPICPSKKSENNFPQNEILSPIKTIPYNFSFKKKLTKSKSSRDIPNILEDNKNNIQKSLLNKGSINQSNISIKSKPNKNNFLNIKSGDRTHKFQKRYSFFFKLKEKEKNPSKTPYLDRKGFNSTYHLKKYDFSNVTNFIKNKNDKVNSNQDDNDKHLIEQNNIPKIKIDYINDKENITNNNKIKKISSKISSFPEIQKEIKNKNINNNNLNELKETQKIGNIKEKEIKKQKNSNNFIINILNKPFMCCLKS